MIHERGAYECDPQCGQGFQLMNDASINTANNKKLCLRWSQYNNYISISANKNQQPSSDALARD